jgi:hypothetical protein
MDDSTQLMMELAQIKLLVRRLTDKHRGVSRAFDASVGRAISGIDAAIVNSLEAVPNPNGTFRRRPESPQKAAIRHSAWLLKQTQNLSHVRGHKGAE